MRALRFISAGPRRLAILLVKAYQRAVSPLIGSTCRFTPTCSQYMIEAIRKKGLLIGLLKGAGRVLRCNPFFKGGYDPLR